MFTLLTRRSSDAEPRLMWRIVFSFMVMMPVTVSCADDPPGKPLRELIDSHFSADLPASLPASDAEFARRVSIDLTGMPPDVDRLRTFLADKSPDKREKLVQGLIASPHFERRLATFLDITLMERRPYKDIKEDEWMTYLLSSVRSNKPWNELAREILSADGTEESSRAAVRFALARDAEPNLLTRDVSRIFFGRDLQCAQCHNHPLVEDYLQADYQGMLAFIAPGFVKTIQKPGPKTKDGKPGKPISLKIYAEKDGDDISFESVFVKNTKHRTGPRLIGEPSILEPDVLPVSTTNVNRPKHSRREKMAALATSGQVAAFNENIANRLWGMMMGRGLVHPPDFHHRDNPPVKPTLMKELGTQFALMKFDMKTFLQEVALSKVYQRSYELPALSRSLNGVQSQLQLNQKKRDEIDAQVSELVKKYEAANQEFQKAEAQLIPVAVEVEKQRKAYAAAATESAKLKTAMDQAQTARQKDAELVGLLSQTKAGLDVAVKNLGDAEITELQKKLIAKLNKTQASASAKEKAFNDASKKWSDNEAKIKAANDSLNQGYAKRKPIRQVLDGKESQQREIRSKLENAITLRGVIDSKIATYEKILSMGELTKKIAATNDDANGDGSRQKIQMEFNRVEDSLIGRFSKSHVVSTLRPLTPEQLCWSTLKATGFYQRYFVAEENKLRKEQKLAAEAKLSLEQLRLVEERTYNVLKGHLNNFVRFYAAGAGQPQGDFFATADQALFAANSGSINSYVNPSADNVTDRMFKAQSPQQAAEELYLAILSRLPSKDEVAEVDSYLKSKDKRQAVMELAWSLINSAEFRFNH